MAKQAKVRLSVEGAEAVKLEFRGVARAGESSFQTIETKVKNARDASEAFIPLIENQRRQYEALRSSIDPVFAASKRYEAAIDTLDESLRLQVITQAEYDRQLEMVGQQYLSNAANAQVYSRTARAGSMQTANIFAQLNDIGVMMASGQSPFILAIQQGTQLNQVFTQMGGGRAAIMGVLGAVRSMINPMSLATLGIIAGGAALVQWGVGALSAEKGASDLEEAIKKITEDTRKMNDELAASRSGFKTIEELRISEEIARLEERRLELMQRAADVSGRNQRALELAAGQRDAEIADLDEMIAALRQAREEQRQQTLEMQQLSRIYGEYASSRIASEQQASSVLAEQYRLYGQMRAESDHAAASAARQLAELQSQAEIQRLIAQYGAESAEVAEARAAAERAAFEATMSSQEISESLKEALMDAWDAAKGTADASGQIGGALSSGTDEARKIADYFGIAYATAVRLAALGPQGIPGADGPEYSGRGSDPRQFGGTAYEWQNRQAIVWLDNYEPPSKSKAANEARRQANDIAREAERITRSVMTAQEEYNEKVARAKELLDQQSISQQTYTRYVEQSREELNRARDAQNEFGSIVRSTKDAIIDAVDGQADAFGNLANMIKRAAYEYLLFGSGPLKGVGSSLFGKTFGGLLGGIFSFEGGGYTGDGPRTGGLDGKGGFMAMVHPGETITDHHRGGARPERLIVEVHPSEALIATIRREGGAAGAQVALAVVEGQSAQMARMMDNGERY